MPDELLTIFKICFLVLLYLFFFRVLRAVWTEVNAAAVTPGDPMTSPAKTAKAPKPPKEPKAAKEPRPTRAAPEPSGPAVLVAIEPPNLAGIEYPLTNGMTVGRGGDSSIVLDDSFLSTHHAAFERRDGEWVVADEGSTNGTYVNNVRVERIARLHVGDRVQLGNVILEVR